MHSGRWLDTPYTVYSKGVVAIKCPANNSPCQIDIKLAIYAIGMSAYLGDQGGRGKYRKS